MVERFNGTFYVAKNHRNWDEYIKPALFAYRPAPSATTQESPFYLLYGRDSRLPCDVTFLPPSQLSGSVLEHRDRLVNNLKTANQLITENNTRAQLAYHQEIPVQEKPEFVPGDKVWVYTPRNIKGLSSKLLHKWHGPYRILNQTSPVNFQISITGRQVPVIIHVNRLKKYYDQSKRPQADPPALSDSVDSELLL